MKITNLLSISFLALTMAAVSCVDDKYDFSDVDTTTRVTVSDLIVPVNMDAIQLRSVLDIDEEDPDNHIKVIDNAYAYVQQGDFTTGNISVPKVTITSVKASTIDLSIDLPKLPSVNVGVALDPISVNVPKEVTDYSFHAADVSNDICDLYQVRGDFDVKVDIAITGVEALASSYQLKDFTLKLPDGVTVSDAGDAKYNETDNTLVLNSTTANPSLVIRCHVSGLKIPAGAYDAGTHALSLSGVVGIEGGSIVITPRANINPADFKTLNLKVDYSFSEMTVKSIDGVIKYTIDEVNVPDINITDLPDVLAQPGTNLILANPCLYLGINNPLAVINAYAQTGFTITSYHGESAVQYAIDNPYFTIAANATDNFCFSPKMPSNPDAAFADCVHVPFTQLSNVLSGDGLPDKLAVDLTNPNVPAQHITDFLLDHDYGNVHGVYKFVAPLQFENGTQITYTDVVDGWSSEDLDKITVTRLDINMIVSTDVPIAVDFKGYPIDKEGKRINNVAIEGAKIDANAQNQQVKITITGEISHLDGIEFEAKASAVPSSKPLSPDMHITLSNLRPCLSGYYQTEL